MKSMVTTVFALATSRAGRRLLRLLRRGAALACMLLVFGCTAFGTVSTANPSVEHYAALAVEVGPVDAILVVDDAARARLDANTPRVVLIESGARRVEIVADGYLSRRYDLDAEAGEEYVLEVELWPEVEEVDDAAPTRARAQ